MKISIVTVCYNSAATIADTLRSVAAQTHPEVEHIVVDGGSTDDTLEIIARHRDRIAQLVSEPDRGVYDAMNKGIALACGEVLAFLNADDVYADAAVLAEIAAVFADAAVDACYGDLVYVDSEQGRRIVRYWKSRPFVRGLFARGWVPAHPTFFARTRLLREASGFDLRYRFVADFELMLRLLEVHAARSRYVPRVMVRMRLGGMTNRHWRNVWAQNVEIWQACRRNGIARTPLPVLRKLWSRLAQFFIRPAAE